MSPSISIDVLVDADECFRSAANTQGKENIKTSITKWSDWLHAEHSPIRVMQLRINMIGIPYYVAMHLVRHTEGVIPFVRSQRSDITNPVDYDRRKAPQDSTVDYRPVLNPQSLINISRRRMCTRADIDTRKLWIKVRNAIENSPNLYVSEIAKVMMPDCAYRGFICHEIKSCGFANHWKDKDN